jgi:hypothetical protein
MKSLISHRLSSILDAFNISVCDMFGIRESSSFSSSQDYVRHMLLKGSIVGDVDVDDHRCSDDNTVLVVARIVVLCSTVLISERLRSTRVVQPCSSSSSSSLSSSTPSQFMLKFDACTQLCYAINYIALEFEKNSENKDHSIAIILYEYLLSLPYLIHRRGKWYKRLCIDYEHLGLYRCAMRACYRGKEDQFVSVS